MMTSAKRTTLTTTALAVLAVLFIALTILSNSLLRGTRIDLTENRLYTLSQGTRNILQNLDEPINLYYFFSDRETENIPFLRTYANRVREMLEEFALYAGGTLQLHVIDPQPFSEEEDRASKFGLQAIPVGAGGESIYFGLAGTNTVDSVETIAFFQPDKEEFLEYDLSKLVYNLAHPRQPIIGLLTTLPMTRGFDPMTRQPREPWTVANQIDQLFEVRVLSPDMATIDPALEVLMLVHPKALPDQTRYAIDQFVLKGGRLIVFVDPNAEMETPRPDDPAAIMADRSSNLPALFEAWGVAFDPTRVVADNRFAVAVSTGGNRASVRHPAILSVDTDGMNRRNVVTAELETVTFATAGHIEPREGSENTLLPLISSSADAMLVPTERLRLLEDPAGLQRDFKATGRHYTLAALLQGKARSAFPDGPPGQRKNQDNPDTHIAESTAPINVMIVADTDLLSDRLWVNVQDFFGQQIATAWADNGDFTVNSLDNLTGGSDLIGIRGRATSNRPFLRVEALKREADARFLATEQQLQRQLQDTERKLNELQSRRQDDDPLLLSPAQRAELARFQEQKLAIRKELRQVRRDLDKDIERLGTHLKLINIGLVPLLISALALIVVTVRTRRRKSA